MSRQKRKKRNKSMAERNEIAERSGTSRPCEVKTQQRMEDMIPSDVRTVVILGHIRPDGDCVGTCLGLYHYLKDNMPALEVEICLQKFSESFYCLSGADRIQSMDTMDLSRTFDLCITCDASDRMRLGEAVDLLDHAKYTICIDHHITNQGFAQKNYIRGGLSSCSETLGQLLDMDKISTECAKCLYLGVVHDTGVFKFQSTTLETMCYAGRLMEKGFNYTAVIDRTYYGRTKAQTLICGQAMNTMKTSDHDRIAYTLITGKDMEKYGADVRDMNGIIDQLRVVDGVEVAVFVYEIEPGCLKVSLRSNHQVDVSAIALAHGGGGHAQAAGFDCRMDYDSLMDMLLKEISARLPAL